jgi:DNA repair protein RadC
MQQTYKIQTLRCKVVNDRVLSLPVKKPVCADDAAAIMHQLTDDSPSERFVVVHLNKAAEVVGVDVIAQGGVAGACFTAAEVFRSAIIRNASAVMLGHNHPSGDTTPSRADITTTQEIEKAGELLGIPVLDHIIVARNGRYCSLLEQGVVKS